MIQLLVDLGNVLLPLRNLNTRHLLSHLTSGRHYASHNRSVIRPLVVPFKHLSRFSQESVLKGMLFSYSND